MFLIPWAVVVSARALNQPDRHDGRLERRWVASAIVVLMGLQTFAAAVNLQVIHTRYDKPSRPVSVTSSLPPQAQPLLAQFDNGIELVGYQVEGAAGSEPVIDVTLYWQAEAPVTWPWTVFRHVMVDGELVGQRDDQPVGGKWPTTCWKPGEVVVDSQLIPLDVHNLERGALRVGLYDAQSGRRLPIREAGWATVGDAVGIPLGPDG